MPCAVSQGEIEYYEREYNKKNFGVEWTNDHLTTEVACYLSKFVRQSGKFDEMPGYVKGWIVKHEIEDSKK